MRLENIELKNFRCFKKKSFDLSSDIVLIYGNNGSGKTSLVEAIHYLCYLKSFRSRLPQEIIKFDEENFFIKGVVQHNQEEMHNIQVGFSRRKKIAKINDQAISSYKELFPFYQVITATIDDLSLVQGSPIVRRSFIDQAVLLQSPDTMEIFRKFKQILQQRNALLQKPFDQSSYFIWTEQLWNQTKIIQELRVEALERVNESVKKLLINFFDKDYSIDIDYNYKQMSPGETFEEFIEKKQSMITYETLSRRSDFGAHLDDFTLQFCNKKLKSFGSRGQQKLLVLLIKIAQILDLRKNDIKPIFILDDFIMDFDKKRLKGIIDLLMTLKCQLIITSPMRDKVLEELFLKFKTSIIEL